MTTFSARGDDGLVARSVTVAVDGDPLAPPVLSLDGGGELTVGFDILGDEREFLRYSVVHCDADWTPSPLAEAEVFDGFNYADVEDYAFSQGTAVHYVHYRITLPNPSYRFRLSGNYLLTVYPEQEPDDVLLRVPFMVSEASARIAGVVDYSTDVDYRDAHQQLTVEVDAPRSAVADPFNDLRLVVSQNYRPDMTRTLPHPSRVEGSRAVYEHLPALIFPAGNEYRRFETVSTSRPGMGVDYVDFAEPYYHHVLLPDSPRYSRSYRYDETQKGRRLVRLFDSDASDTEADYTVVHFALDMLPVPDAQLYIEGDLTNRRLDGDSRMRYNPDTGRYERALLLKQGAYNYQYVAVPAQAEALPEGDYYQTLNDYLVLAYYRPLGGRYDRLVGVAVVR